MFAGYDYETVKQNIRTLFTNAVEKRMMSSRRVGSLLSGDSPIVLTAFFKVTLLNTSYFFLGDISTWQWALIEMEIVCTKYYQPLLRRWSGFVACCRYNCAQNERGEFPLPTPHFLYRNGTMPWRDSSKKGELCRSLDAYFNNFTKTNDIMYDVSSTVSFFSIF